MSKINHRWEEVDPGVRWEIPDDELTWAYVYYLEGGFTPFRWGARGPGDSIPLEENAESLEAAQVAAQDYIRLSLGADWRLFEGDEGPPHSDHCPGAT